MGRAAARGSSLSQGAASRAGTGDPELWAISDRGPNIKLADAHEWYGWEAPDQWRDVSGAKLMPRADIGPALALLDIIGDAVRVKRTIRLHDGHRSPVSGLPVPDSGHAESEPVLDLEGRHLDPDPSGMDTEGIALLEDGTLGNSEKRSAVRSS